MSSYPSQQVSERVAAIPCSSAASFRFAQIVSDVLCPPVLALPMILLSMWLSGMSSTLAYAAIYFAVAVIPPVLYVLYLVQSGQVQDFHLPNRKERTRPYLASISTSIGAWGLMRWLGAPALFSGIIFALIVQVALLLLITLFWQISIHTASIAGFVTFAMLATWSAIGLLALAWTPLVPLVAWSRLHLQRHTLSQILIGIVVGVATIAFATHGLLW